MAAFLRQLKIGSNSKRDNVVQSHEYHMPINNSDWTIPEEKIEHIYRIGPLDFKTALSVKTHEETISLQEEYQSIQLLNHSTIQKYLRKEYRYIHIGLIQIAVKPLFHLGVDAPIYLALRDTRIKRYKPSLLSMIQTNVCNGPIYFNCAPNFSIDLTDPHILKSVILDIHLQGNEFEKHTKNFAIIYRLYYRPLSSHLNPKFIMTPTLKEETTLLQVDADRPTTYTPKRLKWNEITIPSEFEIKNPQIARNIEQTTVEDIIEKPDGNTLIRFASLRERPSTSYSWIPARHSNYESTEINFPVENTSTFKYKTPVPEVINQNQSDYSPTHSQMKGEINVISKPYKINHKYLQEDFEDEENTEKRI